MDKLSTRFALFMPLLIAVTGGATALFALFILFQIGMQEERSRLQQIVKSQALLIDEIARFDVVYSQRDHPDGAFGATLSQVISAHGKLGKMGRTGEFVIGRLVNGKAAILVHDLITEDYNFKIPSYEAIPLTHALNGKSGVIIAQDYWGHEVLAAFEPVPLLGIGLVAKVDTAELYEPYITAGGLIGGFSFLTLLGGIYVSRKLTDPVLHQEQTMAALSDSQKDLNTAQTMAHLGSWRWNMLDDSEQWSDEQFRIFGYEPGEIIPNYQFFLDSVHPVDLENVVDAIDRTISHDEPYNIDFRIMTKNGDIRFVNAQGSVKRDDAGAPVSMIGTVLDITDKKKYEAKILEEKDRAERYLSVSGTMILMLDCKGRVISINDSGCRVLGCSEKDAVGRDWFSSFVPLEDQKGSKNRLFAALNILEREISQVENRVVSRNNGVRTIAWRIIAIRGADGETEGVLCSGEDVTDVRESEQKFYTLSHRNETILNTAGDGIYGIDINGLATFINPAAAAMLGYDPEELIGHPLHDLLHHTKADGSVFPVRECPINRAVRDGERQQVNDDVLWRKDGISIPVEYTVTPIDGQEGISGAVVVFRDVTEQRALQAQIIQTSKLATLGEMATGVAHELNQPLNIIRMAATNITRKMDKGPADADYIRGKLDRISAQTERAAAIIDHMRIFGRPASGRAIEIDVSLSIRNAVSLMNEQLRLASIEVAMEVGDVPCHVRGHAVQLEQVVMNLVGNARDALLGNGEEGSRRIGIRMAAEDGKVTIMVDDNAGGIEPGIIERIFEPFFTTKEVGKGTGLGLSISYGIIRDMGGEFRVANQDGGACFTIELPLSENQQQRKTHVEI